MDFTGTIGTPIYATGNGVVIESKFDKGYGRHVVIDHGFSYKTLYAHMDKILAKKGQKSSEGTLSDIWETPDYPRTSPTL